MEEVFAGSCQAITNRISIAVAVQIRSTQEDCCSERLSVFSLPFSWMKAWRSITIFERMKRILPTQIGRRYKTSERSRINCMNNCKRTSKKYCFSARGSRFWDLFGWFELVFLINFHYFFAMNWWVWCYRKTIFDTCGSRLFQFQFDDFHIICQSKWQVFVMIVE